MWEGGMLEYDIGIREAEHGRAKEQVDMHGSVHRFVWQYESVCEIAECVGGCGCGLLTWVFCALLCPANVPCTRFAGEPAGAAPG